MPGPLELALIFLAVLLLFGAKRIPEIARGLGKGIREFKDATTDIKRELTVTDAPPQIPPPNPPAAYNPQGHGQPGYAQQPGYTPPSAAPQPAVYAAPPVAGEAPPAPAGPQEGAAEGQRFSS